MAWLFKLLTGIQGYAPLSPKWHDSPVLANSVELYCLLFIFTRVVLVTTSKTLFVQDKVAIKKCSSIFKYPEDGKRILREIKLMQIMNHRNILTICDVLPPTSRKFEEVYMVTPCLDTDLSNIIRSQTLSEGHCKYIIYQVCPATECSDSMFTIGYVSGSL